MSEEVSKEVFNFLAIGDPHFKDDNGEITDEMTYKISKYISDNLDDIDAVVVLGDILHRHEKINLHPFHRAMNFLQSIRDSLKNKYLYILIGNHDRSNNRVFMTDEHVFNPLKYWKNTLVVDKAVIHEPLEDFKVLLLPYVPPGRFKEAYETVISEKDLEKEIKIVFAHQEFYGAKMNTITSNEGDPWETTKPLCVSGHIHDYDMLKSNMIYVGTPIQHGYSDHGKKTVSLFRYYDDDTFKESRIDLKIKGRITLKTTVEDYPNLEVSTDKYYVKIKVSGTKTSLNKLKNSKLYKDHLSKGVVFNFLETPVVDLKAPKKPRKCNVDFLTRMNETLDSKSLDYLRNTILST